MGRTVATPVLKLVEYEQTEHELEISCAKMLRIILLPDVQWTSVDHAHSLDMRLGRSGVPIGLIEAQKRKARGVKAGIPDMVFWYQQRGYAIELKRNASEPLSDDQKIFCRGLLTAGIPVKICWTKHQVLETVEAWGLTRRFRVMA
jgi:hypothetical protein